MAMDDHEIQAIMTRIAMLEQEFARLEQQQARQHAKDLLICPLVEAAKLWRAASSGSEHRAALGLWLIECVDKLIEWEAKHELSNM